MVAFGPQAVVAEFVFESVIDFVADGVELTAAIARGEYKVVELWCEGSHVEHHDILTTIVSGGPCGGQRELQAPSTAGFKIWQSFGDGKFLGGRSSSDEIISGKWRALILLGPAPADEWRSVQTAGQ